MTAILTCGQPLASLADVSDRTWVLLGLDQHPAGDCFVADATDPSRIVVRGFYRGQTGDVFDCGALSLALADADLNSQSTPHGQTLSHSYCDADDELAAAASAVVSDEPAVHVIGSLEGDAGQVTVRQEQGNYLRIANWDRIDSTVPLFKGAQLRTLPQCGCGGSLGAPKLFGSFAEMSAYHFCAFYL